MAHEAHVLLICGSVRRGSTNEAVLRTVDEVVGDHVSTSHFTSLADLPHFNPDDDLDPLPPAVVALRTAVGAADALLFCTPEYAGSLPGSFKNLLDWTVGGMETVDKPAGWINISTAPSGAAGAHDALGTVLRYTGASVIDDACARVPVRRDQVAAGGTVSDAAIRAQVAGVVEALVAAAPVSRPAGEVG